ncbi:sodium:solute symporter family protein [Halorubrum lacusprofundi]|uniref:Na+/solute symporter n=1 Tax=Halorubrum lacusprofundi (strain ATCC 49239 / DSM 5036 / JCM 8891 / ACAM 34) TaxID=416348 RepID=B9LR56_HALLT|nr:sodium:solute symporter family protein [Halorubrum lacusprofundi]ACM57710.1 Na+/solute symporter [Halorubrum lacusprofundi ATCC 49239]MCG1005693.1 sodium:solute symporter family protein [Halorubrum lacusprofundi]
MTLSLSLGIVVGYLLFALAVGLVAYRVSEATAEDYYLANRSIGTVVLLFTTFATLLSAFTFFGGPNLAFAAGPEWLIVMGTLDGVLFAVLWYAIGYRQWLIGDRHGYVTLGEMLGDRFGSVGLRALVAGVSLLWLFPYVMLQQMGAGEALVGLTDGVVPYWGGAALVTAFMILYVVLAGMRGVAWTDTVQGLFMLSVVWIAAVWVVSAVGGVGAATGAMLDARPEFGSFGGGLYSPGFIISTAITIAFGVTMFPQINQRFFVAKSGETLKRSFVLWPVLVLLLFLPAFMLGAWAAGMPVEVPANANVLPVVLDEYTPAWFAALVIAGAMAAMMSSSDSMLLSGSSYFTRDVYRPVINADASERREAWIARIGVAVFALLAFVASLFRPGTLIEVGDTAFSGFALLALPVICALYWDRTTRSGMIVGVLVPQIVYLAVVLSAVVAAVPTLPRAVAGGWDVALGLMVLSAVLTVGVSLVTVPTAEADASRFAVAGD